MSGSTPAAFNHAEIIMEGGIHARCLALAGFVWLVYDYFLTLEQEIRFLWAGSWSISKALFFWNRYFPPVVLILGIICLFGRHLSDEFCSKALRATFITDYIGITVVQAIVVMRVWYILSGRLCARAFVVTVFLASVAISMRDFAAMVPSVGHVSTAASYGSFNLSLPLGGCTAPPITNVWTIFLPYLVAQTVLFAATLWPSYQLRRRGHSSQIMSRLVRDGSIFYSAFFVAAVITTFGSIQHSDLSLLYTAVFSNFLLAVSSTAVSRLILSIRSLASQLDMNPDALLSTAELSRIQWRRGAYDGEIIVEVNTVEADEYSLGNVSIKGRSGTPGFYTTEVGVFDDIASLPLL